MAPVLQVRFYCTANGREPVRDWLKDDLSSADRRVIGVDIKTVQFGWPIGMPIVRKIEPDLWEVRSRIQNSIARTLFTIVGTDIVLLHGFVKKSQKIPKDDLQTTRARLKDLR